MGVPYPTPNKLTLGGEPFNWLPVVPISLGLIHLTGLALTRPNKKLVIKLCVVILNLFLALKQIVHKSVQSKLHQLHHLNHQQPPYAKSNCVHVLDHQAI